MARLRKMTRKVAGPTEAMTTSIMALADARKRNAPLSLETRFPGGYVRVLYNEITSATAHPTPGGRTS